MAKPNAGWAGGWGPREGLAGIGQLLFASSGIRSHRPYQPMRRASPHQCSGARQSTYFSLWKKTDWFKAFIYPVRGPQMSKFSTTTWYECSRDA
jgi:hypothetical protein